MRSRRLAAFSSFSSVDATEEETGRAARGAVRLKRPDVAKWTAVVFVAPLPDFPTMKPTFDSILQSIVLE